MDLAMGRGGAAAGAGFFAARDFDLEVGRTELRCVLAAGV